MGKFEVKEIRGKWRDPRAEETSAPTAASNDSASSAPPSSTRPTRGRSSQVPQSVGELMRELVARPAAPDDKDESVSKGLRDLFGIVGTTQAEVFKIEEVVAHGGFSVIYRAKHLRFAAPAALKCLKIPPTLTGAEREEFLLKFKKEGELLFRLSSQCPEVVRPLALDAFRLGDGQVVPFIALEWLQGATLKETIVERILASKKPLSLKRAVQLLTPVARALARAHNFPSSEGRLAILHCDLKPDNIFVAKQDGGEVLKIFDFGIAKVRIAATREAGGATLTTGRNMFTPAYAAPEQWAPDRFGQTGPWTDLFALAITLAEVITQRPALEGSSAAMLTQCLDTARRPTPRTLGLTIDDEIEAIFLRALAVDPRERTRSVEEFWSELEEAVGLQRSLTGRRSDPFLAVPVSFEEEEAEASVSAAPPKPEVQPEPAPEPQRAAEPEAPATEVVASIPENIAAPTLVAPTPAGSKRAASVTPPRSLRRKRDPLVLDLLAVAAAAFCVVAVANWYGKMNLPVGWIALGIVGVTSGFVALRYMR
ncbi:MAG: serine/threonine protein kinase [Polyangiaceae bacterium]|nr:serine/threonine protein kinase [Polyangiaceae bacterium]